MNDHCGDARLPDDPQLGFKAPLARMRPKLASVGLSIRSFGDRVPPRGVARRRQGRPRYAFRQLAARAAVRGVIGDPG